MVKHSKKLILRINRREIKKVINNYCIKVIDPSVTRNELEEIGKSEDLMMWKLFGKIYDDIITKIDNKVGKKRLTYEDIEIITFLQWKFWSYYIHLTIFWLYVEQTSDFKECIYNTIHCKYGEHHYLFTRSWSTWVAFLHFVRIIATWWARSATIFALQDLKLTKNKKVKRRNNYSRFRMKLQSLVLVWKWL